MARELTETETRVNAALARAAIFWAVQSAGAGIKRGDWECDGWRFDFSRGANLQGYARPDTSGAFPKAARESFEYFTGLGHREVPKSDAIRIKSIYGKGRGGNYGAQMKAAARPVAPHVAGLLHSLALDAHCGGLSFSDFCAEMGYSNDSIQALNVYRACEETARRYAAFFPATLRAELADILADY